MSDITNSLHPTRTDHDADYQAFDRLIAERVAESKGPLFTTDADRLFDAYLAGIPGESGYGKCNCGADRTGPSAEAHHVSCPADMIHHSGLRQHYNCNHCRRFIERYGGLVNIDESGRLTSPIFWNLSEVGPEFFQQSICNIDPILTKAKVTGVFINSETTWGTPFSVAGPGSKHVGTRWTHLHGKPSEELRNTGLVVTAEQVMSEKKQDYIMLRKALAEFPLEACVQAVRVLETDAVDRSEKTLGVAKWLLDLHRNVIIGLGSKRQIDNLIWLAVATAPPGGCHVRSTMIGTLLDDIVQGLDFNSIKRRWDAKMHPLTYQRPTAPPSDGAITAANKIMEKLGAEGALTHRYARFDEILRFEWREQCYDLGTLCKECGVVFDKGLSAVCPHHVHGCGCGCRASAGAFDNLRQKQPIKAVELPPKPMKWEQFRSEVLTKVHKVEVLLDQGTYPFYGMVTAVNQDSPPMLQWDGLQSTDYSGDFPDNVPLPRNPTSWYFWHGGSLPQSWGLQPGWTNVDGICLKPCHWQREFPHQGSGVFFVLRGAKDSRDAGGGYFPETLRSEYHGIRSVIEAHSRRSKLAGRAEGDANGIALGDGQTLMVRVDGRDQYIVSL